MKVIIYAPFLGRGGSQRVAVNMANALSKICDVKVFGTTKDEIYENIEWGDVNIEFLQNKPKNIKYENWAISLNHLAINSKIGDVVWTPHSMQTFVSKLPRHMPIVSTIHDADVERLHKLALVRKAVTQSKFVVVPSIPQRQRLAGLMPRQSNKIRVAEYAGLTPPPVPPTEAHWLGVKKKYNLPDKYLFAFHCYSPHKDPDTILRAYRLAKEINPSLPPLVIAGYGTQNITSGGNDLYVKYLSGCYYKLEFSSGDVFVLGALANDDEIAGLYYGAELCLSASTFEAGVNSALFEAFAAKKPVICTNIDEFAGVSGFTWQFQPKRVTDMAILINYVMSLPQHDKDGMVNKAYQWVKDRTWLNTAKEYKVIFEDACATI